MHVVISPQVLDGHRHSASSFECDETYSHLSRLPGSEVRKGLNGAEGESLLIVVLWTFCPLTPPTTNLGTPTQHALHRRREGPAPFSILLSEVGNTSQYKNSERYILYAASECSHLNRLESSDNFR